MRKIKIDSIRASLILFFTVFTVYLISYMTKQCFNAAMADIVNEGFMTKTQTGFIIMVFYLIYAPMQIVGGIAADKFDSVKLIIIGLIGSAVSNAVIFFNNSYYVMLAVWGFNGFIQFGLWPSVLKILTTKLNVVHRRKAVVYISVSQPMGAIIAYLTAANIKKWQYNFLVSSIILIASSILLYTVYSYLIKRDLLMLEQEPVTYHKPEKKEKTLKMGSLIFASGLFFVLLVSFMKEMVLSIKGLAPVMLMEIYESVTPKIGNTLNIIVIIFGIFGVIAAGYINTRYAKKEFRINFIAFVVTAPAWLALVFIGKVSIALCVLSLSWIYGVVTLTSSTVSCWMVQFQKYNCTGTVAGLINAAASAGVMASSYFFCLIADKSGWQSVIYLCILFCALSAVMTVAAALCWKRFNK